MRRKKAPVETFNCPNCGTEVRITARSCPECGADDETGWKEDLGYGTAFPELDDDFNYDEFVQQEFGSERIKPRNMSWWVWGLAFLVILSFILMALR